jgi:hypothetical protein
MKNSISYDIAPTLQKTTITYSPNNKKISLQYNVNQFSEQEHLVNFLQTKQAHRKLRYQNSTRNMCKQKINLTIDTTINFRNSLLHYIYERINLPTLEHKEETTFQEISFATRVIQACDNFIQEQDSFENAKIEAMTQLSELFSCSEELTKNCVLSNILQYAKDMLGMQNTQTQRE